MRTSTKLLVIFLLISISVAKIDFSLSQTLTTDAIRNQIHEAYKTVLETYNVGGSITDLTEKLNQALKLTSQAENLANTNPTEAQRLASEAQTLANNVIAQAPSIKEQGQTQGQITTIITLAFVATLVALGVLIYFSGPKAIWKIWLKLRKNYRVNVKNSSTPNNNLIITGKEASAIILGALIIIAFFAAAQVYLPQRAGESFSELGILGPQMKLGDYPKEIVAGETVNLNIYVGNQMGKPMDYIVMVKLGDNLTAVDPALIEASQQFEKIVDSNQTWNFPVGITMTQSAINQRIIFELWIYNETISQNQYHQRWGQVWLNVTAPAT